MVKKILGIVMLLGFCMGRVSAQEKQKLQIGDPVPPLKYAKWLQGPEPITEINKNKLYVVEFWATWCGPCIQAMPHLSELSKKHAGKIDFIGCDVWENTYGGPKDQESYAPKVARFVQDQYKLGRLTYNVIMDNTAEDMGNQWLKAAGIGGIPTTFVIEKGRIAWIGHPIYLDSILAGILEGTYNAQVERNRQAQQAKKNAEQSAGYTAAIKAYKDAEAAKDYEKALRLMDTAIAKFPATNYMFTTDKFMLLLKQYGEEKAIAYGRELQKEKLPGQVLIANLYKEDNLSKKVNEFGAEAVSGWGVANAKVLDIQATFEARAGHYKEAAATEQKAIEKAKAEKDNSAMTESVISDMQKKAEEYQEKANGSGQASKGGKLGIGDKAPELRYGKWLKGTPTKLEEPGRLYIVEFWATWCGPCIASMPHLSEFAKKHEKEATVIGVNIWEGAHGDSSKSYDSFLPKVSRFVNSMGDKMAYNVIMDNNDQFMGNNWMKAAGQDGIPCSFMIKDGTILWIGHPINLDSIVTLVTSGNYDVATARQKAIEKEKKQEDGGNSFSQVMSAYQEAVKGKEFTKAIQLLDSEIEKLEAMGNPFKFFKFQTLLENFTEDSAMKFLKEWRKMKNPQFTGSVGALICTKPGLSKKSYQYGIELLKGMAEGPNSIPPVMYNLIAKGYANMGDYKAAVEIQKKTVDLAKKALKEGKYAGFILEDTVSEYEKTLAEYKKQRK